MPYRLAKSASHMKALLTGGVLRWVQEGGPQFGAAIAFYTMFALAPLLVVAIAVAGAVFGAEAARGQIVGEIEGVVGHAAAQGIEAMIESAWRHPNGALAGLLGLGTLLVGATGVFTELRLALNAMGKVTPMPSAIGAFVRVRLTGLALVLGFGFLAIVSLLLSAALAAVNVYLSARDERLAQLLVLLDWSSSIAVLTLAFAALLRWLPDRPPSWHAVWLGALSSAVLFSIGKNLIGLYLARASVASSYGAAGSFVVVMLWVYYSAQILLFGGALAGSWDGLSKQARIQTSAPGGIAAARADGMEHGLPRTRQPEVWP
jgi:membrane protein